MPPQICARCGQRIPTECTGQHTPDAPTDKPPKPPKK